jgi:cyclophilin family peptidyl-prolyl cis-trans isomerase
MWYTYQTADGWLCLGGVTPERLPGFWKAIGMEGMGSDERFDSMGKLLRNREDLNALLDKQFSTQPTGHWLPVLEDADIFCAPVLDYEQLTSHEQVAANAYTEPVPNSAIVAVLRTSEGDVHIQFFSELCPEHMKNFVTLARKGVYNETLFHFVRKADAEKPLGVMGGDPFTFFYNDPQNKKHVLRWGSGGLGYEIPPESGRYRIAHRAGIVTSQMAADADWDNGVQFMIMTGTDVDLDKRHTPFAKVVEGQAIVDKLAARTTAGQHATFKDDPDFSTIATRDLIVDPAILHKVIIYENGKALAHDFPLADGERAIALLSGAPGQPLEEDAAFCGRLMRAPDGAGEIRLGLDVPFPEDVDAAKADPKGERIKRAK